MLSAKLLAEFLNKQKAIIGDALASPGHGFASSRLFRGIGLSDDNSIMVAEEDYKELFQPADEWLGERFGGTVFHSCGNWEQKISMVKQMKGILWRMEHLRFRQIRLRTIRMHLESNLQTAGLF